MSGPCSLSLLLTAPLPAASPQTRAQTAMRPLDKAVMREGAELGIHLVNWQPVMGDDNTSTEPTRERRGPGRIAGHWGEQAAGAPRSQWAPRRLIITFLWIIHCRFFIFLTLICNWVDQQLFFLEGVIRIINKAKCRVWRRPAGVHSVL